MLAIVSFEPQLPQADNPSLAAASQAVRCPSFLRRHSASLTRLRRAVSFLLFACLQGYGFNTFGEVCACWAQDIILIALIFRFSNTKKWIAAAVGIAVSLGCVWLLSPYCPRHVLCALQASNIITMALGSRLPQIILNMRRGNAGVLSVTTCLLNVAGNAARIFTTIVLTGDMLMLGGFLSQGTLNSILLSQSLTTAQQRRKAAAAAAGPGGVVEDAAAPAVVPKVPAAAAVAAVGPDSSAGAGGFIMQPAT